MADIIQLLPDAIANQIAAGEVIQRPASAVKELLENAIDAGSTEIKLVVRDAGKTLIQVIDNGCGMSDTDARLCYERHATSKIRKIDDLFAIRTKGFRGEAMASIAAVAQVEMRTRLCDEELGTLMRIEGSEIKVQEPCQCPQGTSIAVKNLFFNVPARRNFLKSNPVEMKHIVEEFQRVALAHPGVFFSLHHNDVELFHLKAGNMRQRIVGVLGKSYDQKLVPVEEQVDFVTIRGFVGKPDSAKKTRGDQYFFVNDRFIKNNYLNHAVFTNYQELIPKDHFPFFCLYLDVEPTRIDINVHPTKQEIKFDDERSVYGFVRVAIRHALAKYSVTPTLDFEQEQAFNYLQTHGDDSFSKPKGGVQTPSSSGNIYTGATIKSPGKLEQEPARERSNLKNWQQLYGAAIRQQDRQGEQIVTIESNFDRHDEEEKRPEEKPNEGSKPYQLHNRYIMSPIRSGFIMLDQQAAHERILYEKYLKAMTSRPQGSQQLLFPQAIHCTPQDAILMKEILPDINALGFDIQEFGQHDLVIHGMPADLHGGNEQEIIESILEDYKRDMAVEKLNKREGLARSLARKTSIKAGKPLEVQEMEKLIDELFACEQPYVAPGGKATFTTFELAELEKRFEGK